MATKRERIDEILKRLKAASPFTSDIEALAAIARIMTTVEDELSGIRRNPNAATSPADGRMYPPDPAFEKNSGSDQVRLFMQKGHRTWIGKNGSIRILSIGGTIEIDLPGADQRTVEDLLLETSHESH